LRPSVSIASFLLACLIVWILLLLRGCINAHDRPLGHGDITFGIAPRGDVLVFNAPGLGGRDLYLLDLSTLQVRQLAATSAYEVDPEFSPDQKSVVYAAGKPGDRADHIFLRSLDGKTVRQLTSEDANDAAPAFSPDGSLIVFTRDKTYNWGGLASNWDGGGVLCVMRVDGTGSHQITRDGSIAIDPHFSPDGKTILFCGVDGVYTVAADGSQPPRPIGGLQGTAAVYSPDGRLIAFSRGRYAADCRILLATVDGADRGRLTYPAQVGAAPPGGGCFQPAFTPDGKRILFFLEWWPDGGFGVAKRSLCEAELHGGTAREIASYGLFDDPLNWRPGPPIQKRGP
jgi:dipeptidyl aminopeptidase/acylaminoacyl peptidase